ncbi:MAG: four helix bundle protein [Bacteroidia bacterium]|nr:four helix bundle protein [Bacteroidia bacterium]
MKSDHSVIAQKSFAFAVKIVQVYKRLTTDHKEYVISKQLLRSGTSIGANVREASHAQSIADFIHKLSISQKESNETRYWLDLLKATAT